MNANLPRREFLRQTSCWAAGAAVAVGSRFSRAAESSSRTPHADKLGWQLSGQTYTYRNLPLYDALPLIAELGLKHVETCFFLGLDGQRPQLKTNDELPAELRGELKQKLAAFGIQMTNYYANLTADSQAARRIFTFARELGVRTIVAEPPAEAFDMIEQLCNEFEINLAVHNHPKHDNYTYWEPAGVLKVIGQRGPRIGACVDTGHWVRSGLKPVECLKQMEGRIRSLHLKDVAEWDQPAARDVPLGSGFADFAGVLKELHRQRYQGVMAIEYEHESPQLQSEVAACVNFVELLAGQLA